MTMLKTLKLVNGVKRGVLKMVPFLTGFSIRNTEEKVKPEFRWSRFSFAFLGSCICFPPRFRWEQFFFGREKGKCFKLTNEDPDNEF